MNIFGFLAVLIAAVAMVLVAWIAFTKPFTIITHYKVEEEKKEEPKPMGFNADIKTDSKQEKEEPVAVVAMDAVIRAANTLMGVVNEEGVNDRKD